MSSFLITLAAASTALLLSGCPDIPGGPVSDARSDSAWKASHPARVTHDGDTRAAHDSSVHAGTAHQRVSEIAWFQGTIDEAFSHRGCPESHPRRTLFRF
ncbi:MAG TPA: hypothetical protein VF764_12935 [Steroidobacteraceae bacterium]